MIFAHTEKERMVAAMTNEEAIVQLEIDATNLVGRLASEPVHNTSFPELWKRKLEAIDIAIYAVKMFDKHEAECERCACNLLAERDALKEEKLISNADVAEVTHGRWLINSDGYYPYCSVCKEEPKSGIMTHYCPNCGAKMDKEDET
jgi:hypothetical protein